MSTIPKGTPERIWLNLGDGDPDAPFPADHEGVTWCNDQIDAGDVEYVRADRIEALQAEVTRLKSDVTEHQKNAELIRQRLERALIDAALALFDETVSVAFRLPIPDTTPPIYVVAGEPQQIDDLLRELAPQQGDSDER